MKFLLVLSLLILGTLAYPNHKLSKRFNIVNSGVILNREDQKHVRVKLYNQEGILTSDKLQMSSVKYKKGKKVHEAMPITKDMISGQIISNPNSFNYKPNLVVATTMRPIITTTMSPIIATTMRPIIATTMSPIISTTMSPIISTTMRPIIATTKRPIIATTKRPIITTTMKPVVSTTLKPVVSTTMKPVVSTTLKPVVTVNTTPKHAENGKEFYHCKPLHIDTTNELEPMAFNNLFKEETFDFDWNKFEKEMASVFKDFCKIFDKFNTNQKRQALPSFQYTGEYFYDQNIHQYCFIYRRTQ
jgi:hypothetical protein